MVRTYDPCGGDILDPGALISTILVQEHYATLLVSSKHLGQVVLKKEIIKYFMYFYGSNLESPGLGKLESCDLRLNKFGKGPTGNAT